jgi:hypothetical protein
LRLQAMRGQRFARPCNDGGCDVVMTLTCEARPVVCALRRERCGSRDLRPAPWLFPQLRLVLCSLNGVPLR